MLLCVAARVVEMLIESGWHKGVDAANGCMFVAIANITSYDLLMDDKAFTRHICIKGAREHNLKNIDVSFPVQKFIVVTGLSGSGKSTLAFGTLYAEGQRRYVESLSAYARQFLQTTSKPDVDSIEGLMPAIAVDQKTVSKNPRSTVGTVTEIYDYLRLLYARIGVPISPKTGEPIVKQSPQDIVQAIYHTYAQQSVTIAFPLAMQRKGEFQEDFKKLQAQGFYDYMIDGALYSFDAMPTLNKYQYHTIFVICDEVDVCDDMRERVMDAVENAVQFNHYSVVALLKGDVVERLFSTKFACPETGFALTNLEPRLFSFNSPVGACPQCEGLGVTTDVDIHKVLIDRALSIRNGAIVLTRYPRFATIIAEIAQSVGCDEMQPVNQWSDTLYHTFFYGGALHRQSATLEALGMCDRGEFAGLLRWIYRQWANPTRRRKLFWNTFMGRITCTLCEGARLKNDALLVRVDGQRIDHLCQRSIRSLLEWFQGITLSHKDESIARMILKEIVERLTFLDSIGLGYLSLSREARTLSGGESQRIRLASQIGSGLTNVLYVLDEPSIGLHPRDTDRLLDSLERLRDLPNTVVVVEHDLDFIRRADHIIDVGPLAGVGGGRVVAQGSCRDIMAAPDSITGAYLRHAKELVIPSERRRVTDKTPAIRVKGARHNNLKNIDVHIPLGVFVGIVGVSGGGKSSLISETVYAGAKALLEDVHSILPNCDAITGLEHVSQILMVSQDPIGRTPRSNPATYCGFFTDIRKVFAATPEARRRGYGVGRFSFNVPGGRCETCEGAGALTIEMNFLPDVEVTCEACSGKRFNRDTLEVMWKSYSIADILSLTVDQAVDVLQAYPSIKRHLMCLQKVGLGYITLAQSGTTFSGGEAQRIKLAKELSRRQTKGRIYILDEPTTGLHLHDVALLSQVLQDLVENGNTVIVIEHNMELIKTVDWIIDMGPEGGVNGGYIVAQGTPEDVVKNPASVTGAFLSPLLTQKSA